MEKIVGHNFLDHHRVLAAMNDIQHDHVVIDKKDHEEIIKFFRENPECEKLLNKQIKGE